MIVQGFNVEFEITVVHSADNCQGETGLTYIVDKGVATVVAECDRKDCTPAIMMMRLAEPSGE